MGVQALLKGREIDNPQKRYLHIALFTCVWYLFAHGYRMANNMFSHDSLLEIYQDDSAWQIALGRWAHPFLIFLRGGLTNPWLIGSLSLLYFILGACLVAELLKLKDAIVLFVVCGVFVCNPAVTCTHASFLQCVDFYSLSLLLAVGGTVLCHSKKKGKILFGILLLTGSMAIYQAYICVAIGLLMMSLYGELEGTDQASDWAKKALKYCGCLVAAALIYWLVWQLFLRAFGIWTADTYNGMAEVGRVSVGALPGLVGLAYKRVWEFFWNPQVFATMTFKKNSLSIVWLWILRVSNISTMVLLIYGWIECSLKDGKNKVWKLLLRGVILFCFPLGLNFVCVLSKGMEHTLMVYAFVLIYIYSLWCFRGITKKETFARWIALLAAFCFVWINVVYANQIYLKKNLQDKAMTSMMTRIVSRMEQAEGYEPGVTKVAFSGYFEYSPYLSELPGFEEVRPYGMGKTTLTYMGTDYAFLRQELNVPVNEQRVFATDERVEKMPCFPKDGSIAYVDDVLVVKISE